MASRPTATRTPTVSKRPARSQLPARIPHPFAVTGRLAPSERRGFLP
jgi:hypothetical protein